MSHEAKQTTETRSLYFTDARIIQLYKLRMMNLNTISVGNHSKYSYSCLIFIFLSFIYFYLTLPAFRLKMNMQQNFNDDYL